ncbi:MAG: hypothetical protein E6R03_03495 [Hyphomicrobiaceae bacterium]|nr:MAG: hypothetical protein E6R03_03495 [Hyphomicrobiaceae bacterium]
MSGFPDLSIYYCDTCGQSIREDRLFGSDYNDEMNFCCGECVESWEESQRFEEGQRTKSQ